MKRETRIGRIFNDETNVEDLLSAMLARVAHCELAARRAYSEGNVPSCQGWVESKRRAEAVCKELRAILASAAANA